MPIFKEIIIPEATETVVTPQKRITITSINYDIATNSATATATVRDLNNPKDRQDPLTMTLTGAQSDAVVSAFLTMYKAANPDVTIQ